MRNLLTATVFSAALLLGGSMALAQTAGPTGGSSHGSGTMGTSPGAPSSMGTSGSGTGMSSGGATSSGHRMASESDVRKQLQAEGYSDISNVKHDGDHYTANAKQDGKSVKVRVDATSGMVTKDQG